MPNDPQQQLDALKRSMCGDCGVGPFKGARPTGVGVSRRWAWGLVAAAALIVTAGALLLAWG